MRTLLECPWVWLLALNSVQKIYLAAYIVVVSPCSPVYRPDYSDHRTCACLSFWTFSAERIYRKHIVNYLLGSNAINQTSSDYSNKLGFPIRSNDCQPIRGDYTLTGLLSQLALPMHF